MSPTTPEQTQMETTELHRPVLLGRFGRILIGTLQLYFVYSLLTNPRMITADRPPEDPAFWVMVLLAFAMLALTMRLGLRVDWGKWPGFVAAGAALLATALDFVVFGRVWAPPLAVTVYGVSIYVHGHMGLCHVLGGVFRVPGCEMRALHYLAAKFSGKDTRLIVCPGVWRPIDDWEMRIWKRIAE